MPLTAAQICTRAAQIARVPGFLSQAGDSLNVILSDLCHSYDFSLAKQTYQFNFNPLQLNSLGQAYQNFPENYLRGIRNECFYVISGVPYPMIPLDQEEGDMLVEQAGNQSYPVFFWTDMSKTGITNSATGSGGAAVPVGLFWQVPSGAYPATVRYYASMPDIANPSTSNAIPWFPNQDYLITRLAGELMKDADDERAASYLSEDEEAHPLGAGVILRRYLQKQGDKSNRAQTVQLDRRRFGRSFNRLKNTKQIGW